MFEVDLTVEQAGEALGLHPAVVRRYCARGAKGLVIFPRAHLLHGSRSKGWRIPEGDVIAYAQMQGDTVLFNARKVVNGVRADLGLSQSA